MACENKCGFKSVNIPESRYSDLLEAETRLAIAEDYLRYTDYVDKDVLKVIVGLTVTKNNKILDKNHDENLSEQNLVIEAGDAHE